jgi:phthalate 4,5-dioxygenase oxygenase subunit
MLSRADNELLTRVGAGTPMGTLMRRYWIPAAFSDQLAEPDGPPVRVKLLGEDLVAFRDTEGRVGLLDQNCPHRTASLFFGRNEECGLRCVYHGWKFDVAGRCVDLPSEPPGSNMQRKVKVKAYPCLERGGIVWTYMGPPALKPDFPDLEWAHLPESHRFASRHIQECNWLQGLEGGFDSSHLAFLHGGTSKGSVTIPPTHYEVVATDFGFVAGAGRAVADDQIFWTANVMLMPFHKIVASVPVGAPVVGPLVFLKNKL